MTEVTAVRAGETRAGDRPFWQLWTANGLSNLGDGLYQFALPLMALDLTRSPSLVSGVTLMLTLAWPVFGLHAGSVVDRFHRQHVLLGVGLLRLSTLGLLTVAVVSGVLNLPMLYLAAIVLGVGETLADTALTALVPATVSADRLAWANGRITAGQSLANTFVGPPLGGILLGIGAAALTAVATSLYGLATLALVTLRPGARSTERATGASSAWGVTDGFRFLWQNHLLRRLTLFTAAMNVWWAVWSALFVIFAVAPGPLGQTPAAYGTLLVAMAVGGIAGSLAGDRIGRALGIRNALVLDLVGTALLVGVPAVTTNTAIVATANVAAGVGAAVWVVLVSSIRQRLTPEPLLGRVYSASRLISWGVLPVGAALGGIGAELLGIRAVFFAGGLTSVAMLVLFLIAIRSRDFEDCRLRPSREDCGDLAGAASRSDLTNGRTPLLRGRR